MSASIGIVLQMLSGYISNFKSLEIEESKNRKTQV